MSHLYCFTKNCYFRLFYVMVTLELEQIFEIILSLFSTVNESIQKLTNSPSAVTRKQRNQKDWGSMAVKDNIYIYIYIYIYRSVFEYLSQGKININMVMNKQDLRFSWYCFGGYRSEVWHVSNHLRHSIISQKIILRSKMDFKLTAAHNL